MTGYHVTACSVDDGGDLSVVLAQMSLDHRPAAITSSKHILTPQTVIEYRQYTIETVPDKSDSTLLSYVAAL